MLDTKQLLYDLFQAYYDARKNKRNTLNQLDFEFQLEKNIIELYEELITWNYKVGKSIYFIQNHPVKREIFAWNFRDRVIHHLIFNSISPIFEKEFIYDSYSCRTWKWTSLWVARVKKFIRSCSENYTQDAYILKLDISWYFMSIDKDILFQKIQRVLDARRDVLKIEYDFIINLIHIVIYNDPTLNSIFKWKKADYRWLPKNKSLFFAKSNCGLPIWNLTSQLFSNIYLHEFDRFIKHELSIKYYGRYVDDFVIIHPDKEYLKKIIWEIQMYLHIHLWLSIHPKKIYLQHFSKWVWFLWVIIKPYRTYIRKRTLWNFYSKIQAVNTQLEKNNFQIDRRMKQDFLSMMNSYLWFLKHHKSYKIRSKICYRFIYSLWENHFHINNIKEKMSIIKF